MKDKKSKHPAEDGHSKGSRDHDDRNDDRGARGGRDDRKGKGDRDYREGKGDRGSRDDRNNRGTERGGGGANGNLSSPSFFVFLRLFLVFPQINNLILFCLKIYFKKTMNCFNGNKRE